MKEIGIKLKDKREENGVSVEEAAEDLNLSPNQIKNIELGNKESFNDVVLLKQIIKDYAKYLGIDGEELIDEFNEYLFDLTSKISLKDIEDAKKDNSVPQKEISSPYTLEPVKVNFFIKYKYLLILLILLILIIFGCIYFLDIKNNNLLEDNITYIIRR